MKRPEGTIFCALCGAWRTIEDRSTGQHLACFEADEQSENYDRDAPWRDWPPYPQPAMDVLTTRDGKERIEWAYETNDGNLEAGWVIYEPGDESCAYLDSSVGNYYDPNKGRYEELG